MNNVVKPRDTRCTAHPIFLSSRLATSFQIALLLEATRWLNTKFISAGDRERSSSVPLGTLITIPFRDRISHTRKALIRQFLVFCMYQDDFCLLHRRAVQSTFWLVLVNTRSHDQQSPMRSNSNPWRRNSVSRSGIYTSLMHVWLNQW